MTRGVRVRPQAEREVEAAFAWYEEQRPGLGREFLRELDVVYERLTKFPRIYAEVYRGLRRTRLRRFPIGVFYLVTEAEILVIAVVHLARDPKVWRRSAPRSRPLRSRDVRRRSLRLAASGFAACARRHGARSDARRPIRF